MIFHFHSSKLKKFADDNFRFDENGRKLSKWVENTEGKGEIANYQQFLLFPQCFQKTWFLCVCSTGLLKTLWEKEKLFEKEKLLKMSNFSFPSSVFYLFGELPTFFIKFEIVICKLFQFGRIHDQSFGKGLNRVKPVPAKSTDMSTLNT